MLKTAYESFSEFGIEKTTTLEIAKKASLSHGSIFAHFPNREILILSVIDGFGARFKAELLSATKNCQTVKEVLKAHLSVLKEVEDFYTSLVVSGPLLSPKIRNAIFATQSGLAAFLEPLLQKEHVPVDIFLNTWLGLVHYYLVHRDRFATGSSVLKEHGEELIEYIT